jgi:hypothetical protein
MKAIGDRQGTGQRPVLVRSTALGPAMESRLANEAPPIGVAEAEEAGFCGECGQPLVGQAAARVWKEAEVSWWVWVLIALGVVLLLSYGLSAWQIAQEPAAVRNLLSDHSASEVLLEGPSVRRAALRAEDQLTPALDGIGFGLMTIVLGVSLVARRSARRRAAGRLSPNSASPPTVLLAPIFRALFKGWALAETVALAAFRLSTIAFLYLLSARLVAGEPPTLDVVQETLDRVIRILATLPDLVR